MPRNHGAIGLPFRLPRVGLEPLQPLSSVHGTGLAKILDLIRPPIRPWSRLHKHPKILYKGGALPVSRPRPLPRVRRVPSYRFSEVLLHI